METTDTGDRNSERGVVHRKVNMAAPYATAVVIGGIAVLFSQRMWLFAILIMLSYLVHGLRRAQRNGYVMEFSDSFYYLGFTLTMAALLGSLKPFSWIAGETPEPADVLQHFGLGMITTLIGVFGRTTLQMYYRTPDETLEATNQQIAAAAEQYLGRLEQLNAQVTASLDSSASEVRTILERRASEIDAAMGGLTQGFLGIAEQLRSVDPRAIQKKHAALAEALERAREPLDRHVDGLRQAELALDESSRGSVSRFVQLEDNLSKASTAATSLSARLSDLSFDRTAVDAALRAFAESVHGQELAVANSLRSVHTGLAAIGGTLGKLDREIAQTSVAGLTRALDELAGRIRQTIGLLGKEGDALANNNLPQLRASIDGFARETQKISEVLDEIIEAAHLRVEAIK